MPNQTFYVRVRNISGDGTSGHDTRGYLDESGVYTALPGDTIGAGHSYRADELPGDVVMLTAWDEHHQLRSVEERKRIGALAEQFGFPIRRGPKYVGEVIRDHRAPDSALGHGGIWGTGTNRCSHENLVQHADSLRPYLDWKCKDCGAQFSACDVEILPDGGNRLKQYAANRGKRTPRRKPGL